MMESEKVNNSDLTDKNTKQTEESIAVVEIDLEANVSKNDDIERSESNTSFSKKLADAHDIKLSKSKVTVILLSMFLSLATAFVDINGLSIVLPYIASDINAELTISWANTSQLISMTIFQLLCGRFADMFGRKNMMVISIFLLGFFQLACGLSNNNIQFFVFRAICGLANGNIQSLTMTVMSDIVTLEERGKYQGYISAAVGVGNGFGPFLGSLFIQHSTWRKYFFCLFSISISSSFIIMLLVPNSQASVSWREKITQIDYTGFFFGAIGIVLLLIPINGGGLEFAWHSAKAIAMLVTGGICFVVFLIVETRFAKLPLIPLKTLFARSVSLTSIFLQCILFGTAFFSLFFYYGYYFGVVRGLTPVKSACFLLCIIVPQTIASALSGRVISWYRHYNPIIWAGYSLWTLSLCLLAGYVNSKTSLIGVAFIMVLNGLGQGMSFQITLVAALAHSKQQDRAVIISSRQVLRFFGGCVGFACSNLIFSQSIIKYLKEDSFINLTENENLKLYLRAHVYSKINLESDSEWSEEQVEYIRELYMRCLRWVFTFWAPLVGTCLILSLLVKDRGLVYKDDQSRADRERLEQQELNAIRKGKS